MKRIGKKIVSLLAVVAIMMSVITLNNQDVKAATGVGYVNQEVTELTERGGEVSVTFTFSVDKDNSPMGACYVIFTWDPSVMEFDKDGSTRDNMVFANEADGEIHAYLDSGTRNEFCGVTLKFKNVLAGSEDTTAVVDYRFKDSKPDGAVEIGGYDLVSLTPDQIQVSGSNEIVLNEPAVEYTIDPTDTKVAQEGTAQFTAKANGEVVEAEWSVIGATSENTKIDANGLLTVAADEKVGTVLTIKATIDDEEVTTTVTVTEKGEDPKDPSDPTDPADPKDPTDPKDENKTNNPKTGDATTVVPFVLVSGLMLGAFVALDKKRKLVK